MRLEFPSVGSPRVPKTFIGIGCVALLVWLAFVGTILVAAWLAIQKWLL